MQQSIAVPDPQVFLILGPHRGGSKSVPGLDFLYVRVSILNSFDLGA